MPEGQVDQFLDAVLAHDPHRLYTTTDFRYTENGVRLDMGDGIRRTLTAKGTYRLFVTDVEAGHVAYLGSVREADVPAMIAVHLTMKNARLAGAEVLVQRDPKSAEGFEQIGYTWTETIPLAERARPARTCCASRTCISREWSAMTAGASTCSRPTAIGSRTAGTPRTSRRSRERSARIRNPLRAIPRRTCREQRWSPACCTS